MPRNNYAQGTVSKQRWRILKHSRMCCAVPIRVLETLQYLPEKEVSGAKCWLQSPSLPGAVSQEIQTWLGREQRLFEAVCCGMLG